MLVPEPIAAMAKLAHDAELALDTVVAVVDFGGSSFDVTLVRRTETGFDLVGEPASLPDFGGTDIDAAVLAHVQSVVGDVTSHVRERRPRGDDGPAPAPGLVPRGQGASSPRATRRSST